MGGLGQVAREGKRRRKVGNERREDGKKTPGSLGRQQIAKDVAQDSFSCSSRRFARLLNTVNPDNKWRDDALDGFVTRTCSPCPIWPGESLLVRPPCRLPSTSPGAVSPKCLRQCDMSLGW